MMRSVLQHGASRRLPRVIQVMRDEAVVEWKSLLSWEWEPGSSRGEERNCERFVFVAVRQKSFGFIHVLKNAQRGANGKRRQ